MTKQIPLTQGKVALCDDEDYEMLMQYKWHYQSSGYAVTGTGIRMHSLLIVIPPGHHPDHINGNGLDNRKENLRPATYSQNCFNTRKAAGTSSKYKGVSWHKRKHAWQAQIMAKGQAKHLGFYGCEPCAAKAYNKAKAEKHEGFGRMNPEDPCEC